MGCLSPVENWARWYGYVTNLGSNVDIWEIGNEINGSWLYSSVGGYPTKGEYGAQAGSVPGCNSGWGVNPSGKQWYATTDFAGNAIQWKSKGSGQNKYEYPVTTPDTIAEMLADSYLIVKTANVGNKVALTLTFCPSDNSIDGGGVNGLNETNNWLQNFVLGQGSTGKTLTSINDLNVMTTYGGAPGGTYSKVLPFSQGVDYVIVSYYSWYDGSSGCSGNPEIWASNPNLVDLMFDNLHTVFPNAKLGWGEFGSSQANELGSTTTTKAAGGMGRQLQQPMDRGGILLELGHPSACLGHRVSHLFRLPGFGHQGTRQLHGHLQESLRRRHLGVRRQFGQRVAHDHEFGKRGRRARVCAAMAE
jgi:hypothetical protein